MIKKCYGDRRRRHKHRKWQLQALHKEMAEGEEEMDDEKQEQDLMDFLEDLEEDKSYRQSVNIYLSTLTTCYYIISFVV